MSKSIESIIHPEGYVDVRNGPVLKRISLKDYASVIGSLAGEVTAEDVVEESIRFPPSIHSMSRTRGGYVVNLYYEEREADIRHTYAGTHRIYMPNVMIRVELRSVKGKEGEYSLGRITWYATDKSRTSLPTDWPASSNTRDHIWSLPMPNMYSDGRMCTGSNRLPGVIYRDWTVLDMLYNDVLIRSQFNNDLVVPSLKDQVSPENWIKKLRDHYKDEDTHRFPYELLVNYN